MKSNHILLLSSTLLIMLFVYTAISKLLDYETFKGQLLSQPLPYFLSSQLVWAIPGIELLTAGLLSNRKYRTAGFGMSVILMLIFTLYVALILLNAFEYIPCSCGGIMESLSWNEHLLVNLLFLAVAITGFTVTLKTDLQMET